MKIALLCPGPSLDLFPGNDAGAYDVVLAVNRAAAHAACDYWVFCDADTFGRCTPIGTPTIVTSGDQHRLLLSKYPTARAFAWRDSHAGFRRWHYLSWPPPQRIGWHRFSSTTALGVALQLRDAHPDAEAEGRKPSGESATPDSIDCYGVDWQGAADWDGTTDAAFRRGDERWQAERELWQRVVAALAEHNIEVHRIEAADDEPRIEAADERP